MSEVTNPVQGGRRISNTELAKLWNRAMQRGFDPSAFDALCAAAKQTDNPLQYLRDNIR